MATAASVQQNPPAAAAGGEIILETEGLVRTFGGLRAVDGVSMRVRKGSRFAIIGPNGSGKTTFFNLVSGFLRPDSGRVTLHGADITGFSPDKIVARGLARTFQLVRPFLGMTVRETFQVAANVAFRSPQERREREEAYVREVAENLGLTDKLDTLVDDLNHGELRLVDIGRAMATNPQVLLLDEPFSSLSQKEIERVSEVILRLSERGVTMVIVEHKLRALFKLVDDVMVLNFGRKIAEGRPEDVIKNPDVISAYLGTTGGLVDAPAAGNS